MARPTTRGVGADELPAGPLIAPFDEVVKLSRERPTKRATKRPTRMKRQKDAMVERTRHWGREEERVLSPPVASAVSIGRWQEQKRQCSPRPD